MIQAIIFDLDDTLYLEADFVRSGFAEVGAWCHAQFGLQGFETAAWQLFTAGHRGHIFDEIALRLQIENHQEAVQEMIAVYRQHGPVITLPRDTVECLQQLRGKYRLGLITDGHLVTQLNKVRALQLHEYLDEVIVTSEFGFEYGKPHVRAFAEIERRFNLRGPRIVYVGDNPAKDFVAPKERAWRTVQVYREGGLYAGVSVATAAECHIRGLSQLPTIAQEFAMRPIES
jgi:putative hydrolase of the HAD superfamily